MECMGLVLEVFEAAGSGGGGVDDDGYYRPCTGEPVRWRLA